jgi:glycerate dehydrogenase
MEGTMRCAVLDGHTLNPGDLSWTELESLCACTVYPRTPPDEVVPRAAEAELVLTNKVALDRQQILALPRLRYIGVTATGFNIVDVAAARERRIPVTNVPAYGTASVVQLTFALLLELTHHVGHHAAGVRVGRWAGSPDFAYWDTPLIELAGLTCGIVGFGNIGRSVARLAQAFGMSVLVHTRTRPKAPESGFCFVDLETLFRQSDVLSLHCPLTPDTHRLVNAERLAWMKPSAFLINTGRGPLIDEGALADALNAGRLAGAGLDVLSVEPPPTVHPLVGARNCLITPHFGWATHAARARLMRCAVDNVRAFLTGRPRNVVNGVLV